MTSLVRFLSDEIGPRQAGQHLRRAGPGEAGDHEAPGWHQVVRARPQEVGGQAGVLPG